MSDSIWIVRPSQHFKHASEEDEKHFERPKEAAREATQSSKPCEIWKANLDGDGSISKERHVLSAYPGHAPDEWFPHRYTPGPEDYVVKHVNVPAGEGGIGPLLDGDEKMKSTDLNQFEIEAALRESDLPASQIDDAVQFLPDVSRLFEFLERQGQYKTVNLLKRLLFY